MIDGNPAGWSSQQYYTAALGSLKDGHRPDPGHGQVGPAQLGHHPVRPRPGADVQLKLGNSDTRSTANQDSMTTVASADDVGGTYTFTSPARPPAGTWSSGSPRCRPPQPASTWPRSSRSSSWHSRVHAGRHWLAGPAGASGQGHRRGTTDTPRPGRGRGRSDGNGTRLSAGHRRSRACRRDPQPTRPLRRRIAAAAHRRRPGRVRRAVPAPQGPALGGGDAHARRPGGGRRRAPGRHDLGLPARGELPRRLRGDHLAAPDRGQRLPGPDAAPGGPPRHHRQRPAGAGHRRRGPGAARPVLRQRHPLDVMAALRMLPPDQQAALVLVDMLGYPVADAAEVLGVSVGTVKSRCSRGRVRLLPHLAHLRRNQTGRPSRPTYSGGG